MLKTYINKLTIIKKNKECIFKNSLIGSSLMFAEFKFLWAPLWVGLGVGGGGVVRQKFPRYFFYNGQGATI